MTIVIEQVQRVEVFINEWGGVTILQPNESRGEDDLVAFPVSRIDDVVAALLALKTGATG